MLAEFSRGFPSVSTITTTGASALLGLLLACAIVGAVFCLIAKAPWSRSIFRSIILLGYLVPTFAAAQLGLMYGFRQSLPTILVTISVCLPLLLLVIDAVHEAELKYDKYKLGTRASRFRLIGMRYALPQLLLGVATCVPWAVLVAMLTEMATGQLGLGVGLFNSMQYGFWRAAPYCLIAALLSILPYASLALAATALRRRFNLTERVIASEPLLSLARINHTVEFVFVFISVGILWTTLHAQAPVVVPSWARIVDRLSQQSLFFVLLDAIARTASATIVSLILGFIIGCCVSLFARKHLVFRTIIVSGLMLVQILPLIVFVPIVSIMQRFIDLKFASVGSHIQDASWIGSLFSGVCVATLACAYTAYHSAATRLDDLPKGLGPSIRARRSFDVKILRYVYLPWLLSSFALAIEIAVPRIFLAVLISEYMITGVGLGGLLWQMRGQRDYAEAWCTLLVVIFAAAIMFVCAGVFSRLTIRHWNIQVRVTT